MRWSRYWFLLPLPLALLAVVAAYLPAYDKPLLDSGNAWNVITDNFRRVAATRHDIFAEELDALYLLARRFTGDGSGRLESAPFIAPAWVRMSVAGDLTRPGNDVYFRRVAGGERLPVRVHTSYYFWRRVTIGFPSDWVGQPVQLIAEAGPRESPDWFGLSNPRALGTGTLLRSQMRDLAVLPALTVALALFLLPGLPAATRLAVRGRLGPGLLVPAAVVFSCLAGYLTFWAYFVNPLFGRAFGGAVLLVGAAGLVADLRQRGPARALLGSDEVRTPLALMALVGLFYVALLYSADLDVRTGGTSRVRFLEFPLAIDNEIPSYFAERLYKHQDPRKLIADWHSSDRPPLQAGLLLLQLPLAYSVGQPLVYSLIAGCAFQCAWVPAVWALWRSGGLPRRRAGLALLFVVLTGFALVNTVYTWPKLLAAALVLVAVTLAVCGGEPGRPFSLMESALLGLASGLGMLAHGGVAFTLVPLGLLLVLPRYYPGLSRLAVGAAVFAAAMAPWGFYQRYYDPPGTKLLRYHLAGGSPTWQDDRPLWRNLVDAYDGLSAGQVVANKVANLKVLFRGNERPPEEQYPWPPNHDSAQWPVDVAALRRCEFLCLFWSPGLLNLGWVVAVVSTRWQSLRPGPSLGVAVPALGLAGVLAWVLLMFGPGTTVVHQGSYATSLLLLAALAAWLAVLPPRPGYALLALQGTVFAATWVLTSPANGYGPANVFLAPLAALFFAALAAVALGAAPAEKLPAAKGSRPPAGTGPRSQPRRDDP
jgi:hypothetical protein